MENRLNDNEPLDAAPGSALMPELCNRLMARSEDLAVECAKLRGLVTRLTEARLDPSAWISPEDMQRSLEILYEYKAALTQAPNVRTERSQEAE